MAGLTNYQMDILASEIHDRMKINNSSVYDEAKLIEKIKKDFEYEKILELVNEYQDIQKQISSFHVRTRDISLEIRNISNDINFYSYDKAGLEKFIKNKVDKEIQKHIPNINKIKSTLVTNVLEKRSIKVDDVIDQLS